MLLTLSQPVQPPKAEVVEVFGIAFRLTIVLAVNLNEQFDEQKAEMGERTCAYPEPVPPNCTESVVKGEKVAVTVRAAFIDTVQTLLLTESQPDHPENTEDDAVAAVRVTVMPEPNDAEHTDGQLMPTGLLVTTPDPFPFSWTVKS